MKPEVQFIKVNNTLKRRAERAPGLTLEAMIEAADHVLQTHSAQGRDALLVAIADARAAIAAWRSGGARETLVATLAALAGEGEAQGRVLGNPLLSEVSTRLSAFVSLFAEAAHVLPDGKIATALSVHLDAMIVALDAKAVVIDDTGQTLISNLELTQRTVKAA
jgi:hypothetical protein